MINKLNKLKLIDVILNRLPGMVYILKETKNNQYEIPFITENCNDIYEITAQEAKDNPSTLFQVVIKEDQERMFKLIEESKKTLQQFEFETSITLKSGTKKRIKVQSSPDKQADGTVQWTGVLLDISESYKIEKEMKRINHHLNTTQAQTKYGSWEWNTTTNEIWWSDEIYTLLEVNQKDYTPSNESYIALISEKSQTIINKDIQNLLETGAPYKHLITLKNNPQKKLLGTGHIKKENNTTKVIGKLIDITEKVNTEKHIHQSELNQEFIANKIHDTIGQNLAVLKLRVSQLNEKELETEQVIKGISY